MILLLSILVPLIVVMPLVFIYLLRGYNVPYLIVSLVIGGLSLTFFVYGILMGMITCAACLVLGLLIAVALPVRKS